MSGNRHVVSAILRRDGTSWVLDHPEGPLHVSTVDEPNPSAHVGKRRQWVVWKSNKGWTIVVDRRDDNQRRRDALKGRITVPKPKRKSVRTVSGGAPGLGRSRRGES